MQWDGEPWDVFVLAVLRTQRRMYADHPQLVPLLVGKTITHPAVIAAYDDLASALVDGGFPEDEVLSVIAVIDAFAIGFGLDLASPDEIWQPGEPTRTLGRLIDGAERGAPAPIAPSSSGLTFSWNPCAHDLRADRRRCTIAEAMRRMPWIESSAVQCSGEICPLDDPPQTVPPRGLTALPGR